MARTVILITVMIKYHTVRMRIIITLMETVIIHVTSMKIIYVNPVVYLILKFPQNLNNYRNAKHHHKHDLLLFFWFLLYFYS